MPSLQSERIDVWALIIRELKSQNNRLQKPTFATAALSLGSREKIPDPCHSERSEESAFACFHGDNADASLRSA
jgi:hypothetical protein